MSRIALGLVGYNHFIRSYPLGPELKARLDAQQWRHQVDIREMNWGPVAIVQDFQASKVAYDRIVLIAAVQRGGEIGAVRCRQWIGGELDVMDIQNRMFEAVTGIISLDNLLVIGTHFKIWPQELVVIEVELPNDTVGTMILEEYESQRNLESALAVGEASMGPDNRKILDRIMACVQPAVDDGAAGMSDLPLLSAEDLSPLADVCHNQLIRDCGLPTPN